MTFNFKFETIDEAESMEMMAREAGILWKKRKQFAQGKIKLNVNPDDECVWTIEECDERIKFYEEIESRAYWLNPFETERYESHHNPYR